MEKVRYMISDAASIVNVESHVLRYWEDELELDIPRNEMGHRYYTNENIQEFQRIKELKEQGYQLKAIRMIVHSDTLDGLTGETAEEPAKLAGGENAVGIGRADAAPADGQAAGRAGSAGQAVGRAGNAGQAAGRAGDTGQAAPGQKTAGMAAGQKTVAAAGQNASGQKVVAAAGQNAGVAVGQTLSGQNAGGMAVGQMSGQEMVGAAAEQAASGKKTGAGSFPGAELQKAARTGSVAEEPINERQTSGRMLGRQAAGLKQSGGAEKIAPLKEPGNPIYLTTIRESGLQMTAGEVYAAGKQLLERDQEMRPSPQAGDLAAQNGMQAGDLAAQTGILPTGVSDELQVQESRQSILENTDKMAQFTDLMTQIVGKALAANNQELSQNISEDVGKQVIKEMNYLMREREELDEDRFRRLDAAIRGNLKKKDEDRRLFKRKKK